MTLLNFKKVIPADEWKSHSFEFKDDLVVIEIFKAGYFFRDWSIEVHLTGLEDEKAVFSSSLLSKEESYRTKSQFACVTTATLVHSLLTKAINERNLKLFKWVTLGQLNENCDHLVVPNFVGNKDYHGSKPAYNPDHKNLIQTTLFI